jgi:hypothetical protein
MAADSNEVSWSTVYGQGKPLVQNTQAELAVLAHLWGNDEAGR